MISAFSVEVTFRVLTDLKFFKLKFSSLSEGIKITSSAVKVFLQVRILAKYENIHLFALAPSTTLFFFLVKYVKSSNFHNWSSVKKKISPANEINRGV